MSKRTSETVFRTFRKYVYFTLGGGVNELFTGAGVGWCVDVNVGRHEDRPPHVPTDIFFMLLVDHDLNIRCYVRILSVKQLIKVAFFQRQQCCSN